MTHYLSISPQQEPFDIGLDDEGRTQYVFNVLVTMRPGGEVLDELVALLEADGVGVETQTIFMASAAKLPQGPSPAFLHLKITGGLAPAGTHNDGIGAYRRPGVQVIARGTPVAAKALADAAYNALVAVQNSDLVADAS